MRPGPFHPLGDLPYQSKVMRVPGSEAPGQGTTWEVTWGLGFNRESNRGCTVAWRCLCGGVGTGPCGWQVGLAGAGGGEPATSLRTDGQPGVRSRGPGTGDLGSTASTVSWVSHALFCLSNLHSSVHLSINLCLSVCLPSTKITSVDFPCPHPHPARWEALPWCRMDTHAGGEVWLRSPRFDALCWREDREGDTLGVLSLPGR